MGIGKAFPLSGSENWKRLRLVCEQMLEGYTESTDPSSWPLSVYILKLLHDRDKASVSSLGQMHQVSLLLYRWFIFNSVHGPLAPCFSVSGSVLCPFISFLPSHVSKTNPHCMQKFYQMIVYVIKEKIFPLKFYACCLCVRVNVCTRVVSACVWVSMHVWRPEVDESCDYWLLFPWSSLIW